MSTTGASEDTQLTQQNRFIRFKTPDLGDDVLLLEKFEGRERISGLFQYSLDLLAEDPTKVKFESLLGKNAKITLTQLDGTERFFQGIICRVTAGSPVSGKGGAATLYRFHAEVVPKVWLLGRRVRSRVFQHKKVPEILTTVLTGYTTVQDLQGEYPVRDY